MKSATQDLKDLPRIKSSNLFPVVGIGASTGGLEAFTKFIRAVPLDSGMAYVLVQHMSPEHKTFLPQLLQKETSVPVIEITDEIKVLPDTVYIMPPNTVLNANDGILQLSPTVKKNKIGRRNAIDIFFSSLAEVHQSHAIGVLLSGEGDDGTEGLRAIKEQGGITCVQDELSASATGMPLNAVKAGVADFIMPPEEMPAKLFEIKQLLQKNNESVGADPVQNDNYIKQILFILRLRKGTDFSDYKKQTITRRIFRRMLLHRYETYAAYIGFLVENKEEQDALYSDMFIHVTSFFRDARVFETLRNFIFPQIISQKEVNLPVRIWIAGCSTSGCRLSSFFLFIL